jgi:pimeloyl-ACP methyl ester carboxylesterase
MKTYVLVQGGNMSTETWNRLSGQNIKTKDGHMGARYWDGTVNALKAAGHRAYAPELGDEFESDLTGHIQQICDFIMENDLKNIIIVGHSYGGFVITGVADKIPGRIRHLVYLDSALPDPGQSLIEILNQAYPKEQYAAALPEPTPPYVEPLTFHPENIKLINKTYIRCTKSVFKDLTRLFKTKIHASKDEWTYIELASSHVPMADMPEEFYKILLQIN